MPQNIPEPQHSQLPPAPNEMKQLVQSFDWSTTPLGTQESWPPHLRTIVPFILHSKIPMIIWWGTDLIQIYNDAYRPILGNDGKHPRILGQKVADHWPEVMDFITPMVQQTMQEGASFLHENQLVPIVRNGNLEDAYWTYSYSPIFNDAGAVDGILIICNETTDKMNVINALEESNNQLHFAIKAADLATFDYNPGTNSFSGNERLKEWFGQPEDEDIDLTLAMEVVAPEDRQRIMEAIKEALRFQSGGNYDVEYAIINPKTKQRRIVNAKGRAWFNDENLAYRFNGTLQDITKESASRKQLLNRESDLRTMILKMPVGVCIVSGDNALVEIVNDAFLNIARKTREQLDAGFNYWESVPEAKEKFQPILAEVMRTGIPFQTHEMLVTLMNGDEEVQAYLTFIYQPLEKTDGDHRVMIVGNDITHQVMARQEVESVIETRTAELAEANKSLQQSNSELAQFAYITSHDLQEPLRKVSVFTEMLEKHLGKSPDEKAQFYIDKISGSATRMLTLIKDVLTFSQLSKENKTTLVSLPDLIETATSDFEILIQDKSATIIADNLPSVPGIPLQLSQLFNNLISNALKFSQKDNPPVIRIDCSMFPMEEVRAFPHLFPKQKYYDITVSDNGIGFGKEHAAQIFKIFQRLHGREEYAGTGIGLAMCKKIAENHHGTIYATSTPGEGAAFHVILPA